MSTTVFKVQSIKCQGCAQAISSALRTTPGIVGVQVDVEGKQVAVDFDSALINEAQVKELIRDAGYEPG